MSNASVLFTKDRGIGTITINRPEARNALNKAVLALLDDILREVKADSQIGVVIITGAGTEAFVSGGDIGELSAMASVMECWEVSRMHQSVLDRMERMEKPSIAAIRGYCLGGGLEVAMACTLRIASDDAILGLPEASLGIIPAYGGTQRLTRLVGTAKAAEMILTAKPIPAYEAFRIGLVNQVVPSDDLISTARGLAESILENGPTAIRFAMDAIQRGREMSLDNGLAFESALGSICIRSPEAAERLKAFLSRRK
jgi:enoyl-CoA hydratase